MVLHIHGCVGIRVKRTTASMAVRPFTVFSFEHCHVRVRVGLGFRVRVTVSVHDLPRFDVAVAVPTRLSKIKAHGNRPCPGNYTCFCGNGALPEIAIVVTPGWIAASCWQHFFPIEGEGGQLFGRVRHVVSQNLSHHRVVHPFVDQYCPSDDLCVSF